MILLGIRRTDDQIAKKRSQCSNSSFSEDITSFAFQSHLESKAAVFYFIVVTEPLKYNSNKTTFSNTSCIKKKYSNVDGDILVILPFAFTFIQNHNLP